MNNLHLSQEAQNDLAEIKAYIEEELLNLTTACLKCRRFFDGLCALPVADLTARDSALFLDYFPPAPRGSAAQ